MADKAMSASSADDLDDNPAISSNADNGDITATSPSADGTEAQTGADQVDDQVETEEGKADAKPKDERAELLAVVKKAIAPKDKGEVDPAGASSDASGKKDGEGDPKADGKAGDEKPGKPNTEEDTRFDKHPRFVKLRRQVEDLQPKAERYEKITGFMQEHDLSPDEVSEGMKIMALMKRRPADAFKALQPYMEKLGAYVGETLPQDLSDRVEAGEISEAAAREMAALRAGREHDVVMTERDREREQERQAQEITARRVSAVNDWAATKRSSDPDFAAIEPLVRDRARALIAERTQAGKPPVTPEAAVEVVEEALRQIRDTTKPLRPSKPGIRHVPSSGSTSTSAQTQPKTSLDAAKMGLNRARARG
jgi:hypothetical protein